MKAKPKKTNNTNISLTNEFINNIDLFLHDQHTQIPLNQNTQIQSKSSIPSYNNSECILELLCDISNFNTQLKHNVNIYNSIFTSRDIPKAEIENQFNSINAYFFVSKMPYSKPKVKGFPKPQKKSNDDNKPSQNTLILDNATEINDTLSINSLDIFHYNNYNSTKTIEYDEPSLQEFLIEETKNIRRMQTMRNLKGKEEGNIVKNTLTVNNSMITPKKRPMSSRRPMSPDLSSLGYKWNVYTNYNYLKERNNSSSKINISSDYSKIKQQKNKNDKYISFNSYKNNGNNSLIKGNYKPKIMRKERSFYISGINPQRKRGDIKILNSKLNSSKVKKGKNKSYFSNQKKVQYNIQKASLMSKPKTSNTSENVSLITIPKVNTGKKKFFTKNVEEKKTLFNIKIDLRELMKEENVQKEKEEKEAKQSENIPSII